MKKIFLTVAFTGLSIVCSMAAAAKMPVFSGHRGDCEFGLQNTMSACKAAWNNGVKSIEIDVRTTADGKIICFHDADFIRIADDRRKVRNLTYAEILKIDIGSKKHPMFKDEKPPLLEDVFASMPQGSHIFVELKNDKGIYLGGKLPYETKYKDEAFEVASQIKYLIDNKLVEPKDIAVLYRNNNQVYALEHELNVLNIHYTKSGGKQLFSYREIQAIINTYRVLFNPYNIIAFENMFNYPKGCEYVYYKNFIDAYNLQKKNLITFASTFAINKHFQNLGFNLLVLQDEMKHLNNEEFFIRLLDVLGYSKFIKEC